MNNVNRLRILLAVYVSKQKEGRILYSVYQVVLIELQR